MSLHRGALFGRRLLASCTTGPLPLLPSSRASPLVTDSTGYVSLSSGRKSTSPPGQSRATPVTRGQVTPSPASPASSGDVNATKLEINTRKDLAEI